MIQLSLNHQQILSEYKNFISEQGWFSIQLPVSWIQYDDKDGTYVFFDEVEWAGNFRVTPLIFQNFDLNTCSEYLEKIYIKNLMKDAQKIKMGDQNCIFFKEIIAQEDSADDQMIYYWFLEKNNFVFIFSFTTDRALDSLPTIKDELKKVVQVINSIKLVSPPLIE